MMVVTPYLCASERWMMLSVLQRNGRMPLLVYDTQWAEMHEILVLLLRNVFIVTNYPN